MAREQSPPTLTRRDLITKGLGTLMIAGGVGYVEYNRRAREAAVAKFELANPPIPHHEIAASDKTLKKAIFEAVIRLSTDQQGASMEIDDPKMFDALDVFDRTQSRKTELDQTMIERGLTEDRDAIGWGVAGVGAVIFVANKLGISRRKDESGSFSTPQSLPVADTPAGL